MSHSLSSTFTRAIEHKEFISHRPFGGSAVSARFHKYLRAAGIDDGETPHSFRVGFFLHPPRLGFYSRADCPVRGLAKHRNGPVLHAPFYCFLLRCSF